MKSRQTLLSITLFTLIIYVFLTSEQLHQSYSRKFKNKSRIATSITPTRNKLNEYFHIHEKIMSQSNASLKKISFNGFTLGGYGNKLYSFLSSLVIAILTDSQIVLRWNDIDKYIKPRINIFDNITENFGLSEEEFKGKSIYFNSAQAWSPSKNIDLLMNTRVPSTGYLRYFYNSIDPFFMEICTNPDYFQKFFSYDLVTNETISLALNATSNKNSTQLEKKERLFKVGFEIGGNLLNRIWHPNEAIMKQIELFVNEYFKNNFVIGLQLRYGDGNPQQTYLNKDEDTIKFINCALEIENENRLKNNTKDFKSFKWFIASDSSFYLDSILRSYPNKAFTSNGTLSHVAYSSDGYARAILDVELLSRCNELVVTGGSTFGWIAAMKMHRMPLFINGFSLMKKCMRANLSNRVPKTPTNFFVFK